MWFVRLSSMLALVVALLLPPGLYRGCCCTRRTTIQQSDSTERTESVPVRACCRARMKSAAVAAASTGVSHSQLKHPPCRCQPTTATLATIGMKQQRVSGSSNWSLDYAPVKIESTRPIELSMLVAGNSTNGHHQIGPPLRKTLCRWVI